MLIASGSRLTLVDAGFGLVDVAVPWHRLGPLYLAAWNPALRASECAARQIEAMGFDRGDVLDIILTHLDPHCAGGIGDFPNARVHVTQAELEAATGTRPTLNARGRYRRAQWAHAVRWRAYRNFGCLWHGFAATAPLPELDLELRFIDLPGHSAGHAGVAVHTDRGTILHVGGAVATLSALESPDGGSSAIRRTVEAALEFDRAQSLLTQTRLRQLHNQSLCEVAFVCSHDPKPTALAPVHGTATRA